MSQVVFVLLVAGLIFLASIAGGAELIAAGPMAVIISLITSFVVWFVIPWWKRRRRIGAATSRISGIKTSFEAGGVNDLREDLDRVFADGGVVGADDPLSHAWHEYRETLHVERREAGGVIGIGPGEDEAEDDDAPLELGTPRAHYRQTEPAFAFFSYPSQVEIPLSAPFFAHLPGMLTGMGIIATFFGLIVGLGEFNPNDTANASGNIDGLLEHVRNAFQISALAILGAVVVTLFEKLALVDLKKRLSRLSDTLDAMFHAGVGEEYLRELVDASDRSAERLEHLREGLINDLRPLFQEQTDAQVAAQESAATVLSSAVIEELREPLRRLAEASERTHEQNVEASAQAMRAALDGFTEGVAGVFSEHLGDAVDRMEHAAANLGEVLDRTAIAAEPMALHAEVIATSTEALSRTVTEAAESLDYAGNRLQRFGTEVGMALDQVDQLVESISGTSASLASSLEDAKQGAKEFQTANEALARSTEHLGSLLKRIEEARGSDEELISAVSDAAASFRSTQQEVESFLERLAGALRDAHETFAREVSHSLDTSTREYEEHLGRATKILADAVGGLSEFVESDFQTSVELLQGTFNTLAAVGALESPQDEQAG